MARALSSTVRRVTEREIEKELIKERAAREVRYIEDIVYRSTSHYLPDDTAKIRGEKRNRYQAEIRRHKLEAIQRENEQMFARLMNTTNRVVTDLNQFTTRALDTKNKCHCERGCDCICGRCVPEEEE